MRRSTALIAFAASVLLAGCSDMTCMPIGAEKAVKHDVLEQLKAPTSAKFSNVSSLETDSVGDQRRYMVSGNVDAQNSYGAMIRNRFIGRVSCDNRNATYTTAEVSLF